MGCLGVHFALSDEEVGNLRSITDEQERLEYLQAVIEKSYFEERQELKAESDKSWDALHRLMADGHLTWKGGSYPLNHVVLGGELLYTGSDYIMSLKSKACVGDIAAALPTVSESEFRRRYFAIDQRSYGFPLSEEDLKYTWEWFQGIRELYRLAAELGRSVLFTADQ
jgi:hypothetical protein